KFPSSHCLPRGSGQSIVAVQKRPVKGQSDVRFGSKADMCSARAHVRFAPNSDRESRHPQTVMSALPPKADICAAPAHPLLWAKADNGLYRASAFGSFARAGCPLLDRPVPTGALSPDLRCSILTNFIAQPCDELFNDLAFGGARCNEDEIRSPAHCPFAAKRRDQ